MENIVDSFDNIRTKNAIWRFPEEKLEVPLSDLIESACSFAGILSQYGVSKGDRVAMILNNSSQYVISLFASWLLNAIAVPVRPKIGGNFDYDRFIKYLDNICDFKVILTDSNIFLPLQKNIINVVDMNLHGLVNSYYLRSDIDPYDTALLQFSSGSTGDPKGVIVTHNMIMSQLDFLESRHCQHRNGRDFNNASWLPINHDMGLFIGVVFPLYKSAQNLIASPKHYLRNPARWFSYLSTYKVNCNFTTNSVMASSLNILKRLAKIPEIDLSSLQLYMAAEKVSAFVVEKTKETLKPLGFDPSNLYVGYGMSENTLCATCTPSGNVNSLSVFIDEDDNVNIVDSDNKNSISLVSVGTTNPGHEVIIRDEHGNSLGDLKLGEICVKGPCVTPGYYNNKILSERILDGNLLKTNDLGFSYNNEIYFYARKDDMIIVGGRNIIPDDIELLVETLPYVRSGGAVLVGIENEKTGATELNLIVELFVEKCKKENIDIKKKIQILIYQFTDVMISKILFVERGTVEKTSSGKKRRKIIKKRVLIEKEISTIEFRVNAGGSI